MGRIRDKERMSIALGMHLRRARAARARLPTRAAALVVVVAALRAQLRVPHLGQLLVKVAVPVPRDDALEQLRGRHAWGAPRRDEFACGRLV